MSWIFFALIGPLFWTVSNFIDKYALEKVTKGIADYAFFGSIGPIVVLTVIPLLFEIHTPSLSVLLVTMFGGFLLNYTYMLYGVSLNKTDASRLIPIFQLRSPLVLIFGILIFNQVLVANQITAFIVMFTGALLLSLDIENLAKPRFNSWSLVALVSTTLFAAVLLINDFSVANLDVPSVLVYFDLGFLFASFSYLLFPTWRSQIVDGLRSATWKKVGMFAINDLADEAGQICSKIALSMAPAAALVAVVQGIHSVYVFVGGLVLTLWFPHIIKEQIHRRAILQKSFGAIVIFVGVLMLNL